MISCLIVNFNCLGHTKNLINNLKEQNIETYELILVDQNSTEPGTSEFLDLMETECIVVRNTYNKPLNHIWNWFIKVAKYEYCAFLNNDILIPKNFLSDTVQIFEKESEVSCVIHPTNHKTWDTASNELTYAILASRTRQGWDFSFRKNAWVEIPEILEFYCGDDFIFENVYRNGKKVAMALSSPIIHLLSQTRKSSYNKVIPNRNPNRDVANYIKLGYTHYLNILDDYSKLSPEIDLIKEES